jgi:hypothetical protein
MMAQRIKEQFLPLMNGSGMGDEGLLRTRKPGFDCHKFAEWTALIINPFIAIALQIHPFVSFEVPGKERQHTGCAACDQGCNVVGFCSGYRLSQAFPMEWCPQWIGCLLR